MTARLTTAANLLRIFSAVVLLSLGFAHQPVHASAISEAYSEAYRLPDGTFADICSEGDHAKAVSQSDHERMPAAKPFCEVCLLAASIILPPPDDQAWLAGRRASLANPLKQLSANPGASSVVRPKSRAPPSSI